MGVAESTLREADEGQRSLPSSSTLPPKSVSVSTPRPSPPAIQTTFSTSRPRTPKQSPTSNAVPRTKIKLLRGVVCGAPNVGKSCLIQRLRGEEVVVVGRNQNHMNTKTNANTNTNTNTNTAAVKKNKRRMMALIPWTCDFHQLRSPLEESPRGIQLHVAERNGDGSSSSTTSSNGRKRKEEHVDFVILLIDRTRRETLEYAIHYMDSLLNQQKQQDQNNDGATPTTASSSSSTIPSICILLNRYDEIKSSSSAPKDAKEGENATERDGAESSVRNSSTSTTTMKEVQEIIKEKFASNETIQIRCFDSCMMNGYGLEALNSFITIPYLKKRERDLALELERIRDGLKGFGEDGMNFSGDFASYEQIQDQLVKQTHAVVMDNDNDINSESQGNPIQRQAILNRPQMKVQTSTEKPEQKSRRKIMPTSGETQVRTRMNHNKDKYASSSEEMTATTEKNHKLKNSNSTKHQNRGRRRRRGRGDANYNGNGRQQEENIQSPQEEMISKSHSHEKRKNKIKRDGRKMKVNAKQTPSVRYMDPKQALEAFLASDDDSTHDSDTGKYPSFVGGITRNYAVSRNAAVMDSDSDNSSDDSNSHGDGSFHNIRVHDTKTIPHSRMAEPQSLPDKKYKENVSNLEKDAQGEMEIDPKCSSETGASRIEDTNSHKSHEVEDSKIAIEDNGRDLEEFSVQSEISEDAEVQEPCQLDPSDPRKNSSIESDHVNDNNSSQNREGDDSKMETENAEIQEAYQLDPSSERRKSSYIEADQIEDTNQGDNSKIDLLEDKKRKLTTSDLEADSVQSELFEDEKIQETCKLDSDYTQNSSAIRESDGISENSCINKTTSGDFNSYTGQNCESDSQDSEFKEESDAVPISKVKHQDVKEIESIDCRTIAPLADASEAGLTPSLNSDHNVGEPDNDFIEKEVEMGTCSHGEVAKHGIDSDQESDNSHEKKEFIDEKNSFEKTSNSCHAIKEIKADTSSKKSDDGCLPRYLRDEDEIDQLSERAEIIPKDKSQTKTTESVASTDMNLADRLDIEMSEGGDNIVPKETRSDAFENAATISDYDSDDSSGLILIDTPNHISSLQPLNRKVLKRSRVNEVEKDTEKNKPSKEGDRHEPTMSKEVLDAIAAAQKEAIGMLSQPKKAKKKSSKKDKKAGPDKKRKKKRTSNSILAN